MPLQRICLDPCEESDISFVKKMKRLKSLELRLTAPDDAVAAVGGVFKVRIISERFGLACLPHALLMPLRVL